jgi:NTE family protein
MIAVLRQVTSPDNGESALWSGMRIHRIADEAMANLGYSSKLNAEWSFLSMLRDQGRSAAESFLGRTVRISDGARHLTWIHC